jgi:hypothetical protein
MRGISKAVRDSKLSPKDELVDFYVRISCSLLVTSAKGLRSGGRPNLHYV